MDEKLRRSREDEWFLQNEQKLMEAARQRRQDQEKATASSELEERRRLHWRRCPKCGAEMRVETVDGIEIEKCSECEGVFFDRGELETLLLKKGEERRGVFRKMLGFGKE